MIISRSTGIHTHTHTHMIGRYTHTHQQQQQRARDGEIFDAGKMRNSGNKSFEEISKF